MIVARLMEQPEDDDEDVVTDWGGYMDYEDTLNLTTKRQKDKARMRADMVKNVLVAIGTADGEIQLWNPLQANETDQYVSTSGMPQHLKEYPTMHYFGIPRPIRSMIYMYLRFRFPVRNHIMVHHLRVIENI